MIRFTPFSAQLPQVAPRLDVSWGGRTAFQPLFTSLPLTDNLRFYVGAFDDKPGGDLVLLDPSRYGKLFDRARGNSWVTALRLKEG